MKEYKVVGLMSGTSLDGVDLAYCLFRKDNRKWSFEIMQAETIVYDNYWKNHLRNLHKTDALTFVKTHADLGKYFGGLVKKFIQKNAITPRMISSHGHTIFHQPHNGFTFQIGDGAQISAATGIDTVCDFRSKDVAFGGQGAPLVPVGDRLLFPEFDFCLNLGGFANISFEKNKQRIAYDIVPVNMALNELISEINLEYDDKGNLSSKGNIHKNLLFDLNKIEFYSLSPPKSLGKEWYEKNIEPLVKNFSISLNDRLRTVIEHISQQIALTINKHSELKTALIPTVIVTGGGAHNDFLIKCISAKAKANIIIPDKKIVDYKEAIIFGFLGVLRITNEINVLQSVTGSIKEHIGGALYSGR